MSSLLNKNSNSFSNYMHCFYALALLWLSFELFNFITSTRISIEPMTNEVKDSFFQFYSFTRNPFVIILNIISIIVIVGHIFFFKIALISHKGIKIGFRLCLIILALLISFYFLQIIG